jgi:hypothetical protein
MIARSFTEEATKHVHVLRQVPIGDRLVRPEAFGQGLFRNDRTVGGDEFGEKQRKPFGDRSCRVTLKEDPPR